MSEPSARRRSDGRVECRFGLTFAQRNFWAAHSSFAYSTKDLTGYLQFASLAERWKGVFGHLLLKILNSLLEQVLVDH